MEKLIAAIQKNETLKSDILSFSDSSAFRIWWMGQSGFLIKYHDRCLLLDPYLSDSLSEKYASTDKPHIRMSEQVIDPNELDFIDVVTSSHNHTDHLDAATLKAIFAKNPEVRFVIPEANRKFITTRLLCSPDFPIGMDAGDHIDIDPFRIDAIPAAHNEIERNEHGQCYFLSYIIQFGPFKIYHSGDTLWYEGLDKILKAKTLDLLLVPINGNKPERRVAGNLSAREAAQLTKKAKAKLAIPHHYNMFEFNTENPDLFAHYCQIFEVNYKILGLGEGMTFHIDFNG